MHEPRTYPQRPAGGRAVVIAVAVAVALLAMVVLVALVAPRLDPLDRQARAAQLAREAAAAETLQPLDLALYAGWRAAPLLFLAAAATVALRVAWRRYGHPESVRAHQVIEALKAQRANVPQSLTYSPHLAYRNNTEGLLPDRGAVARLPGPAVPAFGALLASGEIAEGRPLVLGVDTATGELVRGDFKSLYSTALGGLMGSGKTWTAAALMAQSALQGARLVVCDPHAGDDESLATRVQGLAPAFLCSIADDERSILDALGLAHAELQARKAGAPQRWPLIVAVDEWLALRRGRLADVLPTLIEDFTSEGRKFGCAVLLPIQRADKEAVGSFRNTLSSCFIHRMRPAEGRMLSGLPASMLPDDVLQLQPGHAYLVSTAGDLRRVAIPRMEISDVQAIGRRLGSSVGEGTHPPPFGFRPAPAVVKDQPSFSHTAAHDYSAPGRHARLSAEDMRIVSLFLAGKDAGAIVTELSGMTSKAGRPYLVKLAEVQEVIRRALASTGG